MASDMAPLPYVLLSEAAAAFTTHNMVWHAGGRKVVSVPEPEQENPTIVWRSNVSFQEATCCKRDVTCMYEGLVLQMSSKF